MHRVAIASASHLGAVAAATVADRGGNAVDAAVASTLCTMFTEPGIIAPGAGAFVAVLPVHGDATVIDAYAAMPGVDRPIDAPRPFGDRVRMEYGGGMETLVGYGSVATPGAMMGLGEAVEEFGRLRWSDLVEPVAELIRHGYPLSRSAATYLAFSHEVIFGWNPVTRLALHDEHGAPLTEGDTVSDPESVAALDALGREGWQSLYTGSLAASLVEAMEQNGGTITAGDLSGYRVERRRPIVFELEDWRVGTNPAPAVGGAALAAMALLAPHARVWDESAIAQMVQAQWAIHRYRIEHLEVDENVRTAIEKLLATAAEGDWQRLLGSPSTIHTSAVDVNGLACSITASAGYGSGATAGGLWLNNCLGEIELFPRGQASYAPGERLPSNMAPTVARSRSGATLAVGSPGATRITSALALTLINVARMGMSIGEAISHPRMHAENFEGTPSVAYEPGLSMPAIQGLEPRSFAEKSMYFGGVQAALYDPVRGLDAASDERRAGAVITAGRR